MTVFDSAEVGNLTDLDLPGDGILESFFALRGDILTARTVRKDLEIMENDNKLKLSGSHFFVFKFFLF